MAVDGSLHADKALLIGVELATQNKAKLSLVYVVASIYVEIPDNLRQRFEGGLVVNPIQPNILTGLDRAPTVLVESIYKAAAVSKRTTYELTSYIVKQAEWNAKEAGIEEVETRVEVGSPAGNILEFAKTQDADLIISGSRGFGSLKSLFLGSTSHKISQLADCSCMTVK